GERERVLLGADRLGERAGERRAVLARRGAGRHALEHDEPAARGQAEDGHELLDDVVHLRSPPVVGARETEEGVEFLRYELSVSPNERPGPKRGDGGGPDPSRDPSLAGEARLGPTPVAPASRPAGVDPSPDGSPRGPGWVDSSPDGSARGGVEGRPVPGWL